MYLRSGGTGIEPSEAECPGGPQLRPCPRSGRPGGPEPGPLSAGCRAPRPAWVGGAKAWHLPQEMWDGKAKDIGNAPKSNSVWFPYQRSVRTLCSASGLPGLPPFWRTASSISGTARKLQRAQQTQQDRLFNRTFFLCVWINYNVSHLVWSVADSLFWRHFKNKKNNNIFVDVFDAAFYFPGEPAVLWCSVCRRCCEELPGQYRK